MELEIKNSFLDEFKSVHNIDNRKAKERSKGFKYIHEATVKKFAEGKDFNITDIDFSKFTFDDLSEYLEYYERYLEPKVVRAKKLFEVLQKAEATFSPGKHCY